MGQIRVEPIRHLATGIPRKHFWLRSIRPVIRRCASLAEQWMDRLFLTTAILADQQGSAKFSRIAWLVVGRKQQASSSLAGYQYWTRHCDEECHRGAQ